jgi:hypothetical protein
MGGRLLSRPAGTLSSIQDGGEGWGEEVATARAAGRNGVGRARLLPSRNSLSRGGRSVD